MSRLKMMLAALMFSVAAGMLIISCNIPPEKKAENVVKAEHDLVKANAELEKAQADSTMAYYSFRDETNRILAENEEKMKKLKATMIARRTDINTQYEKDLDALTLENEKLKTNLKTFTYGTNENWEAFKTNINRDLDKLGKSISAMSKKAEKRN